MKNAWNRVLLLILCCGCLAACTGQNNTEDQAVRTMEEDEQPSELEQDEADALLAEKLQGTDCDAVYSAYERVEGEHYYTYTVLDKEDNELSQMLAVNSVSGEIYVFDPEKGTVADYSEFQFYNPKKDEAVSWEGTFVLGGRSVSLEPVDEESFEFRIMKKDEKELVGVARVLPDDRAEAEFEDGEVSLQFRREENSLEIRDNRKAIGFGGIYEKK